MPTAPPQIDLSKVPESLREHRRWVCWRRETRDGKPTKVPYSAVTGVKASVTRAEDWSSFEAAERETRASGRVGVHSGGVDGVAVDGVGFVFVGGDGFCGIDVDDCIGEDGTLSEGARSIIDRFASYTEISPSGRGVKIFIRATKPSFARSKVRHVPGTKAVEVYDRNRFFTVTGRHVVGTPLGVEERQAELDAFCVENLAPKPAGPAGAPTAASAGVAPDDDRLLDRARRAANGAKFAALFDKGDTAGYGGDDSAADQALCNMLWFWTGDLARVDWLFRRSALYRPKWERSSYREPTLVTASQAPALDGSPAEPPTGSGPGVRSFPLTDLGNAERLTADRRNRLRFCVSTGRWFEWMGTHWSDHDQGAPLRHAGEVVRSMLATAATIGAAAHGELARWSIKSESRARLDAMVALAQTRSELIVKASDLDRDTYAFNCLNGTIDLRTGVLRPANPDDLVTKVVNVWHDTGAQCPRFLAFLDRIFAGDAATIGFMQRFLGMCLTGEVREQLLPIFQGPGANGKSVLCDLMLALFGEYATIAPASLITASGRDEHPTEIADLLGRRLVIASESEEGAELKLQQVKRLTGDSVLKGRFMRKDFFEFHRTHKLVMVTNNPPTVREHTEAVWRRVRIVPFTVVIPPEERDSGLRGKLLEEASGILNWLVRGCLDWQAGGLGEAITVEAATREYEKSQDNPACFVEECFERRGDASEDESGWFVPWASVLDMYRWWCHTRRRAPMSDRKLAMGLDRLGVPTGLCRFNGTPTRGRTGIRVRRKPPCDGQA